ncbi:hypothetical protein H6P81_020940 [Aristolochia fimbriata]|uniref:TF-B3 domain-containing protein n=1 Tax=Aristolochia fimbriata TaxID=158543 RepID=A0AAV7DVV0_ARIFI|nr:hypothetical protein H6P81_020940 [Aristolochia fimbriata]
MEAERVDDQIDRPHFFRIMMGNFAKHLRIPPAFTKFVSAKASKDVTLVGPSGKNRRVKLDMRGKNYTYLKDGWQDFVKDHSLQEYDLLVFRYNGEEHFNVQIFDKTACEKEDALINKRSRPNSKPCEGRKKRVRLERSGFLDSGHISQQKSGFDDVQDSSLAHGVDKVTSMSERDVIQENVVVNAKISSRSTVFKEENPKNLDEAKFFTSKNPYIKVQMSGVNVRRGYTVHIPAAFSRKYLPRLSGDMRLRGPQKRCWVVRYISGKSRDTLSGGWTAFVRDNKLKEGMLCIFELTAPLEMEVHIFHHVP